MYENEKCVFFVKFTLVCLSVYAEVRTFSYYSKDFWGNYELSDKKIDYNGVPSLKIEALIDGGSFKEVNIYYPNGMRMLKDSIDNGIVVSSVYYSPDGKTVLERKRVDSQDEIIFLLKYNRSYLSNELRTRFLFRGDVVIFIENSETKRNGKTLKTTRESIMSRLMIPKRIIEYDDVTGSRAKYISRDYFFSSDNKLVKIVMSENGIVPKIKFDYRYDGDKLTEIEMGRYYDVDGWLYDVARVEDENIRKLLLSGRTYDGETWRICSLPMGRYRFSDFCVRIEDEGPHKGESVLLLPFLYVETYIENDALKVRKYKLVFDEFNFPGYSPLYDHTNDMGHIIIDTTLPASY